MCALLIVFGLNKFTRLFLFYFVCMLKGDDWSDYSWFLRQHNLGALVGPTRLCNLKPFVSNVLGYGPHAAGYGKWITAMGLLSHTVVITLLCIFWSTLIGSSWMAFGFIYRLWFRSNSGSQTHATMWVPVALRYSSVVFPVFAVSKWKCSSTICSCWNSSITESL